MRDRRFCLLIVELIPRLLLSSLRSERPNFNAGIFKINSQRSNNENRRRKKNIDACIAGLNNTYYIPLGRVFEEVYFC